MSQLVLEIKNEMVKERLLWLLQHFKKDELEIIKDTSALVDSQPWSDEYIEQNWRELALGTQSAELDDDDRLYGAAIRYYDEKHPD